MVCSDVEHPASAFIQTMYATVSMTVLMQMMKFYVNPSSAQEAASVGVTLPTVPMAKGT